jgi:hypothetical protein
VPLRHSKRAPIHRHAVQGAPGVRFFSSSTEPGHPVLWNLCSRCADRLRVGDDWLVAPTAAPAQPARGAMMTCAHTTLCVGSWGSCWLLGRPWMCRYRCRRRRQEAPPPPPHHHHHHHMQTMQHLPAGHQRQRQRQRLQRRQLQRRS